MTTTVLNPRHAWRGDPMLAAGVIAVALALALFISMLPGLARVPGDGAMAPAPTPAPIPIALESGR